MPDPTPSRFSIRRYLPSAERLRSNRSLRWLGPLLERPWLWHFNRRNVALGAAIGVFFGFLIPVLQIAGAAVLTIALRANLPVAAMSTLVSNPITYAPIFIAAYRIGSALLGEEPDEAELAIAGSQSDDSEALKPDWTERFAAIGKPLMLGLFVMAVTGSLITYFGIQLLWRLGVVLRLRRRRRRHRA